MHTLNSGAVALGAAILVAAPAFADDVLTTNNGIVSESLCVGASCTNPESYAVDEDAVLRLKGIFPSLEFVDTSNPGDPDYDGADTDWKLRANSENVAGDDFFAIEDMTAMTRPFFIRGGAPNSSLVVTEIGRVGIGTALPANKLNVAAPLAPSIRFDETNSGQAWELIAATAGVSLYNHELNWSPFGIEADSEGSLLTLSGSSVGVGTFEPETRLHVASEGVTPGLLVEDTGPTAARGLLTLRNNGIVYFQLEDTTRPDTNYAGRAWNFQNQSGEFRVTTKPGGPGEVEMRLTPQGDMYIKGSYFAGGTELNVPDYVFGPDYELRPLHEVAAFIDENSHLPDIPSAEEIAANGLNLSEMQMDLLRKVEELTLYTLEQEKVISDLGALNRDQADRHSAEMERLQARLQAVEAALAAK